MAKKLKGKAKAAAKKKPAKVTPISRKATNGSGRTVRRTKSPRSQTLPGMEQVRNRSLDRLCESLGDTRDDLARLQGEEADLQSQCMGVMQRDGVTAYRHAGIELALVPGGAKLRVRKLKDKTAQASTAAPPADDAGVTDEETQGDEGGESSGDIGGADDAGEGAGDEA